MYSQVEQEEDMYEYPEDEIETVHIYVVPEKKKQQRWQWQKWELRKIANGIAQFLVAFLLSGLFTAPATQATASTINIAVPATFLPVQQIQASAAIVATGSRMIQATQARGVLTIYNGSELVQQLSAGFIVTSSSGIEIETDQAVTIPAANLPAAGIATVTAHSVQPGAAGNIAAATIRQQDGSSLVIKNLIAFTGGQDARTEQFTTSDDQARALEQAKAQARAQGPIGLMAKPCGETDTQDQGSASVVLACQFVTYEKPGDVQVLAIVCVEGESVILRVRSEGQIV